MALASFLFGAGLGAGIGYAAAVLRRHLELTDAAERHTSAQAFNRYRGGLARTTARRLDAHGPRVAS